MIGLSVDKITDRFRKLVASTDGVRDGVTFHGNRHATASELIATGLPLPAVAARLGHASTRTTATTYAHALPNADSEAALIMERLRVPKSD